jgi:peptide/nickel transport system permease protein
MQRYIISRVLQGILTLVALSLVVFMAARATGDPVLLLVGPDAPEEQREAIREELGLNKPLITQYLIFAKNAIKGDLGTAIRGGEPVSRMIMDRFPATVKLALATSVFAVFLGLILGILCAIKKNKAVDWLGRIIAVLGQSLPSFWVGIMLMLLFSVAWGILPVAGIGGPTHYILPVLAGGGFLLAGIARLTRSSMLEVLGSDYITFARARGTSESLIVLKHALRNAAIPVVTFAVVLMAFMLTGSIVIETVFAWPGVGRLAYQSITSRDFPVIQGIVLLYGAIFVFANLLADILYVWLDPRIRYQRAA